MVEQGEHLYSGRRMGIAYNPQATGEHCLKIGERNYFLPRGFIEDIHKREDICQFESDIKALDDGILFSLKEEKISLESFQWALTMAKLKETKDYAQFLYDFENDR
jgi:hypothetical protein